MNVNQYLQSQLKMAKKAMAFGIASAVFGVMYMPYFAVPLAAFGILFALLSRGNGSAVLKEAKIGIITGLAGAVIAVTVTVKVLNALNTDEDYRNNIIEYAEMLYGDDYEELYGESLGDSMKELFGGEEN